MIEHTLNGYTVRCNFCRILAKTKKGIIKVKASEDKAEAIVPGSRFHRFEVWDDNGVRHNCHLCDGCYDEVCPIVYPHYEDY